MEKFSTGIAGLDDITNGGLPRRRSTLIAGAAGCGKSLMMLSVLLNGFCQRGESAVFLSFEETPEDIIANAAAIGLHLEPLIEQRLLHIEHISRPVEASHEIGSFSLDGLLLRIELALNRVGAQAIAIDTIETIFNMFEDQRTIRSELVRILAWLKQQSITTLFSGEKGSGDLTRHGLEEYISDCVIYLDQRSIGNVVTRRLRILKYRGSSHGNNEYPFLIDDNGISVMPLTSARLDSEFSNELLSSGIPALDRALHGGIRRNSTTLYVGPPGSGKSILASYAVMGVCQSGQRGMLFSFEQSPSEIIGQSRSIGLDFQPHLDSGRMIIRSVRPTLMGLERHLVEIYRTVERVKPDVVVVDPISSLVSAGSAEDVHATVIRLIDYLKRAEVTAIMTMEERVRSEERDSFGFSSIVDLLVFVRTIKTDGDMHRGLTIAKRRGGGHEHKELVFSISPSGMSFEGKRDEE